MRLRSGIVFAVAIFGSAVVAQESSPRETKPVTIGSGQVKGLELASGVRAFKGIPYAAPPTGELRWKAPRPVAPWDGVRACSKFGPSCPQPDDLVGRYSLTFDEDCLSLNVWAAAPAEGPRPVMVWIHADEWGTTEVPGERE